MKRWWKRCRAAAVGLAACMLLGSVMPVAAAQHETGNIRVTLKEARNVELTVYRVADYEDGDYILTDEYEKINADGTEVDLNAMETADDVSRTIHALHRWATEHAAPAFWNGYIEEELVLQGVSLGMYLVVQNEHDTDRWKVSPLLLGVPYWKQDGSSQDKVLEYDVVAHPKDEEVIEPPTEPETTPETTPPTEPETVPETAPPTEPVTIPVPEDEGGVLGQRAERGGVGGVLGARTWDAALQWMPLYLLLMTVAAGSIVFVIVRRKRKK